MGLKLPTLSNISQYTIDCSEQSLNCYLAVNRCLASDRRRDGLVMRTPTHLADFD
jgi:hypothetical protein